MLYIIFFDGSGDNEEIFIFLYIFIFGLINLIIIIISTIFFHSLIFKANKIDRETNRGWW